MALHCCHNARRLAGHFDDQTANFDPPPTRPAGGVRAAEGLLASPVAFNHFGQTEPKLCQYMTKVEGNQFVTINNGKPFCGTLIPNSGVT
jgi:hypothetical protein